MNVPKSNTVLITDRNSRNPVQLDHARWQVEIACPEFCALYPEIPKHWPFIEEPTAPTCEPQSTAGEEKEMTDEIKRLKSLLATTGAKAALESLRTVHARIVDNGVTRRNCADIVADEIQNQESCLEVDSMTQEEVRNFLAQPTQPPAREATVTDGEIVEWLNKQAAWSAPQDRKEWYFEVLGKPGTESTLRLHIRDAVIEAMTAAQNGRTTL
jgi:hypothetical protein